jgi:uncharacterized protein (TIGR02147 family)
MAFFDETDFRSLLRNQVSSLQTGRRGIYATLARVLGLHTTSLSQIMAGKKNLSLEHAAIICNFFDFSDIETQFFLLLVQFDRAGHPILKDTIEKQITKVREQSGELSEIVPSNTKLSLEQQATFYSDWQYSAIRILSSIDGHQTAVEISERLKLPRGKVSEKLKFLLGCGLCIEESGKIRPGPAYTHLDSQSPMISKHHANWRIQAILRHPDLEHDELAYSSPMSLSKADAVKISSLLKGVIKRANEIRTASQCETMRCLSIDWFGLVR